MKSVLIIEHGLTTCAIKPGVFCQFLWVKSFGTKPVCHLFDDEPLREHKSGPKRGWLARCNLCREKLEELK